MLWRKAQLSWDSPFSSWGCCCCRAKPFFGRQWTQFTLHDGSIAHKDMIGYVGAVLPCHPKPVATSSSWKIIALGTGQGMFDGVVWTHSGAMGERSSSLLLLLSYSGPQTLQWMIKGVNRWVYILLCRHPFLRAWTRLHPPPSQDNLLHISYLNSA